MSEKIEQQNVPVPLEAKPSALEGPLPQEWNANESLAALVDSQLNAPGPHLTFPERCGAYWALRKGVKAWVIGKAFGITPGTVSALKSCIDYGQISHRGLLSTPARQRYRDVALEFQRLGEDAFQRTYYTEEIHLRLMRIKERIEQSSDDRTRWGPNLNADKFSFELYGAFRCGSDYWRLDFTPGEGGEYKGFPDGQGGPGWRYTDCQHNGEPITRDYVIPYMGREAINPEAAPKPFRTSKEAHAAVFKAVRG